MKSLFFFRLFSHACVTCGSRLGMSSLYVNNHSVTCFTFLNALINFTNGFLSKREGMLAMFTTGWVELFLSYGDAGFAKGTERDVGFQFLHEPQAGRNEPIVHIAVLGFMNSNGYVSSQVLSHVTIITRLHVCKYHKIICVRSWSLTSMTLCSRLLILVYQINK